MTFDWTTFWYVIVIGGLSLLFALTLMWFISLSKKRKQMPSHIELYFDENFKKIMNEWDLATRDKAKEFRKDMNGRLVKVGNDISGLEKRRSVLDKRLKAVEAGMNGLEGL